MSSRHLVDSQDMNAEFMSIREAFMHTNRMMGSQTIFVPTGIHRLTINQLLTADAGGVELIGIGAG